MLTDQEFTARSTGSWQADGAGPAEISRSGGQRIGSPQRLLRPG